MAIQFIPNARNVRSEKFSNAIQSGLQGFADMASERERMKQESEKEISKQKFLEQKLSQEHENAKDLQAQRYGFEKELAEEKHKDVGAKLKGDQENKINQFQSGLDTIQRMRGLGKEGRLGFGSHVISKFGGKTAKDVGEYEQLGKSLIQLSSNIPIRNKAEFEALAENLYDASLPDSQREGILNAMERIIRNGLESISPEEQQEIPSRMRQETSNKKERKPLTSFVR